MLENITHLLVSFCITGLFIWLAIPIAEKVGLIDKPGGHKTHQDHIPVIGGIGIFLGLLSALWLFDTSLQYASPLVLAGLLLLLTGTLDDKYFLSAYTRFGAQIGAAAILVLADNTALTHLGYLLNSEELFTLSSWAIPLTIFATVGVINAVNMTDGLDGLAGGLSLVTLSAVVVLFSLSGIGTIYLVVPMFTMAAILAFLMFNFRTPWLQKAKVFMGNGGSMLLGIILAWLLIKFSQGNHAAFSPAVALWIFAIPLLDTVCIMLRRLKNGKSPFAADREHLHHLFLKLEFSVQQSVILVISITALFAVFGIAAQLYGVDDHWLFYAFLVVFTIYFFAMDSAWKRLSNSAVTTHIIGGSHSPLIKSVKQQKHHD